MSAGLRNGGCLTLFPASPLLQALPRPPPTPHPPSALIELFVSPPVIVGLSHNSLLHVTTLHGC